MTAYRLDGTAEEGATICGHIGGAPQLVESEEWPRCRICDSELIAFLEIELPTNGSRPFQPGSRLQIFTCREHDDICGTIYSDYTDFDNASRHFALPDEYWKITDGHYLLRLLPPSTKTTPSKQESRLSLQHLAATATDNDSENGFKMFGQPYWVQDAEPHQCSCGASMQLLLQIPDGRGFQMASGADEQPNSFSTTEYCIFLGNQLYLLACTKQCDPHALWPVLQN